jgi:ribosomal protein S26
VNRKIPGALYIVFLDFSKFGGKISDVKSNLRENVFKSSPLFNCKQIFKNGFGGERCLAMVGSRGRERLVTCESCRRQVPRGKAVDYQQRTRFSTDLRTGDNVSIMSTADVYYCISCAKHRKIFEKKKRMLQRKYNEKGF